jgi:hypothetical protein
MKQLPFKCIESVEGFIKRNPIQVHKVMDLDEGLAFMQNLSLSKSTYQDQPIQALQVRHRLIKSGHLFCACCGLEGTHFRIERDLRNGADSVLIVQFYGYNSKGDRIVFNHDHIIPQSLNGNNSLENAQLTCCKCNTTKGSFININEINEFKSLGRYKKMVKNINVADKLINKALAEQPAVLNKIKDRRAKQFQTPKFKPSTSLLYRMQQYQDALARTVTL